MGVGYRYEIERCADNDWVLRFPGLPEAITGGATEDEARSQAEDCLLTCLTGYIKARLEVPSETGAAGDLDRVQLPSLVRAKLAVYARLLELDWTNVRLAEAMGTVETTVRRILDLDHQTQLRLIDRALAAMDASLSVELRSAA
jgi:antitoxin HicB